MANTGGDRSGTLVSRLLHSLPGVILTPPRPTRSMPQPADILETIPSDAGSRPDGQFDRNLFRHHTGLIPEGYVFLFLEANGRRVRQQALVGSLNWSDATVSRLLTSLETDGAIERHQLGRENIICLPDSEPSSSTDS